MIRLANETSEAEIALEGAELSVWRVGGTRLLWTPDPAIWGDTAPILFPVVGWTRGTSISVDGERYPLGLHGFARSCRFTVIDQEPSRVVLRLVSNTETRALYPFDWSLDVEYSLHGASIETRLTVRNTGARTMPYACGLHPGFCWPFAGGAMEDYAIVFGESERASVPIISSDGLFTRQTRCIPLDGRWLALSKPLLEQEALCFLEARSDALEFRHASGAAITITLEDFPHVALWSRPAGRFLSIEAWTGHGDHVDADGDLYEKPSMRHLPPGTNATHAARFAFASL